MADWDDSPTVLIFSDSDRGLAASRLATTTAGGRIAATATIAQALDRLDMQVSTGLVVVDVQQDHGPLLDRLFDRLDCNAAAGRHASVVTVAPHLIDIAAARLTHDDVALLANPSAADQVLAVTEMMAPSRARLSDIGSENGQARLQKLSEEVSRIARTLARLSDERASNAGAGSQGVRETAPRPGASATFPREMPVDPAAVDDAENAADATTCRAMIRARRLRDQFFGAELFADPAWDMLLDLAASRIERRAVAVSSLCIAAAVPATTALRWIRQMTEAGLFRRVADPLDGRRIFIELTEATACGMRGYLAAAARVGAVAGI